MAATRASRMVRSSTGHPETCLLSGGCLEDVVYKSPRPITVICSRVFQVPPVLCAFGQRRAAVVVSRLYAVAAPMLLTMAYETEVTRFGSMWHPPRIACAPLRALAARHGVPLSYVSDKDAAAAALAADAWMLVVGASSLKEPYMYGESAVKVLSAVLLRAAGSVSVSDLPLRLDGLPLSFLLSNLERHALLIPQSIRSEAVASAASDLQVASDGTGFGPDLAGYGAALFLLEGVGDVHP